jgi:hypothetical protein
MVGCVCSPAGSDTNTRILERWSGVQGGADSFATVVINDGTEWVELWKSIGRDPPTHRFDASKTIAVAVFIGQRRTGGYSVEITTLNETSDYIRVEYIEREPTSEMRVAQVLTTPWTVALISRTSKRVEFSTPPNAGAQRR